MSKELKRYPMNSLWATVFAVGLLVPAAANADLISNGDFSTGLTGWTVFTTANGTTGAGLPDVVSFNTTGSGASNSAQFNVGEVNLDIIALFQS